MSLILIVSLFGSVGIIWVVVFHKLRDWNHTMLVSLDLLIDVVSLQFDEDLNNSSLHSCLSHQRFIIRSSKSFLADLDLLDWLHSISHLLVLSCHELALLVGFTWLIIFKNENVTLFSEMDSVKNLDAWLSCIKTVMEVTNIFISKPLKFFDFKHACNRSFDPYLI